jgi:NHS family xanthosine MFS transporter
MFHISGGVILFMVPLVDNPSTMFWIMLVNMIFYMPTIALSITIAYSALKSKGLDIIKEYPPIRVWGTVGFIVALWIVSLSGFEKSAMQFYVAAVASFMLGIYAFTLPKCLPLDKGHKRSFVDSLGLKAFALFKNAKMALFFIFAMLLGAALQLTNAYGDTFLHDFAKVPEYKDLIAVKFPAIIMSISQISETLFILTIPFFLRRFGIKTVMLFSMIAWVLRFGLFAYGDPGSGLWMIILSCIIYGLAFDFFNISGSLFVETQSDPAIRASSQGLFMMMTNGFGAVLGSRVSGIVIDTYFKTGDSFDWQGIWLAFAGYSLVVAVLFAVFFKHKHENVPVGKLAH